MNEGWCQCTDDIVGTILSLIIPCVVFGQNNQKAGVGKGCVVDALLFWVSFGIYHALTRGELQEKLGVERKTCAGNYFFFTFPYVGFLGLAQEKRAVDVAFPDAN